MKFLLVALCYVAFVSAQRGQSQQNSAEARRAEDMIRRCETQEQVTDNDMKEFSQQRRPTSTTGKCLHACLMESVGLLQNGKLSVENSIRFMSQMARGNNELAKIIEEIAKECENVADDDRCELAFKIMTCTEQGIQKRQDQLSKFMPRPPQHQQ